MTDTRRSRVPDIPNLNPAHYQFLDSLDKRQQRLGEISDLDSSATLSEVIDKINAIMATHRTR